MTREDVLKLFPEATDEQITNLLNKTNSEVARERGKVNQYKEKADKADELQSQLDNLNSQGMSEVEKANKALETANNRIAELEKRDAIRTRRASLMEKLKISAEDASKIISDDGSMDDDVLGQIFADGKKTAVAEYEKQKLVDTPNPDGTKGGTETKTEAEKIAEGIGKTLVGTNDTAKSIVDSYL